MKSKIIASTLLGIGFLIGASALSALAVWTGAPGAPTTCPTDINDPNYRDGCNAPIHVGLISQDKSGPLRINVGSTDAAGYGLNVFGISRFWGGIQIPTNAGLNKVLISDETGKASWQVVNGVVAPKNYIVNEYYQNLAPNPMGNTPISIYDEYGTLQSPKTLKEIPGGWNFYAVPSTANKLCQIVFPGTYMASYRNSSWNNPGDNVIIIWETNKWVARNGSNYNSYIAAGNKSITCSSIETINY